MQVDGENHKFTGWGDHESSQAVLRAPLSAIEDLENRDQER